MARVRVAAASTVLLASCNFFCVLASVSPNLPTSVLTAPKSFPESVMELMVKERKHALP